LRNGGKLIQVLIHLSIRVRSLQVPELLEIGKDECRLKFDKIILEGEYTAAQLISALNYELLQKKESSVATNSNSNDIHAEQCNLFEPESF